MSTPLATLELMASRAEVEPLGTIALPVRDHISALTAVSLMHTDWSFLGSQRMDRLVLQGSILTMQRNEAVQKMRGKFLLFIDDDMVFSPNTVGRLISSYQELREEQPELPPFMLGALCFRRSAPFHPTLYVRQQPTAGTYSYLEKWDDGYVEVDATGCAFLLIPVEVFEAIAGTEMPPFEERARMNSLPTFFRWDKALGEDLHFCQDAKQAGVRIFVDTRIEIGHLAEIEVGRKEYLAALSRRPEADYRERLAINESMGLPTLTTKEARDLLG